jgi:hypothetical protein
MELAGRRNFPMTSSHQSDIIYMSPNIGPYMCCCFIEKLYKLFLQTCLCVCNLHKHQTVYNICGKNERIYAQIRLRLYIYLYM